MSSIWLSKSAGARTENLRRLREWQSRRDSESLNTYNTTQEAYTGVVAGRSVANETGCCDQVPPVIIGDDVYVVGSYNVNPINFYDASGNIDISESTISSFISVYLVKYTKLGQPVWAAKMGNPDANTTLSNIVADVNGDLYVIGTVTGTQMQFYDASGVSPGITITLDNNIQKLWLAKYNSEGDVQWATYVSSAIISGNVAPTVNIDSSHNVFLTSEYDNSGNGLYIYEANNPALVQSRLIPNNRIDGFIVKYTNAGIFEWVASIGYISTQAISSVACDSKNNAYVSGLYFNDVSSSTDITIYNSDGSISPISFDNNGGFDSFLIKFNSAGFAQWGTHIGGVLQEARESICIDTNDNVYIAGDFVSTQLSVYSYNNLVPSFIVPKSTIDTSFNDIYLVKYNENGVAQWATKIGGIPASELLARVTVNELNQVTITGISRSSTLGIFSKTDLSSAAITIIPNVVSSTNAMVFVANYDTNGIVRWASRIENTRLATTIPSITTDQLGDIYIVGDMESVNVGGGILNIYDASGNLSGVLVNTSQSRNAFVVKYSSSGSNIWNTQMSRTTPGARINISTPYKAAF